MDAYETKGVISRSSLTVATGNPSNSSVITVSILQ